MTPTQEGLTAPAEHQQLFANVAHDLLTNGYSVRQGALPPMLVADLIRQLQATPAGQFSAAGIGNRQGRTIDSSVRKDSIRWISGSSPAETQWLNWAGELQRELNRRLLLGLFSLESHFAHYPPGAFYRRHRDAFRGDANRVLSIVAYLNNEWLPADGGELVLYPDCGNGGSVTVMPEPGTLVAFLSEELEHEVLPARRDRFSIAGWFRVNNSTARRVDPTT